ncbi:squalene synthase HpnC [Zavarzinia sp. CC-PAN008]|uniref:squalene synthase HpnC n=1 Tax=Zavarzinia sp. CC-PAN008 TaxID=3243332 RepID=UPI003F749D89
MGIEAGIDRGPGAPAEKNAGTENFPVGSLLIAPALRPTVMAFYDFARAADDIADDPTLSPDEKLCRLDRYGAGLRGEAGGEGRGQALKAALDRVGVPTRHGHDLLDAFRQDAVKTRYDDVADLLAYCNRSAAPVGRFLLDLHGEDRALWPASDALCNALQVINHLQDCGDDRREVDRVYIPLDVFARHGATVEDLDGAKATPGLLAAIGELTALSATLLDRAAPMCVALRSTRLALESAAIIALARDLVRRLERGDPLCQRLKPSRPGMLGIATRGVAATIMRRTIAGRNR